MILECRDEVRLGMIKLWSALSLVGGRSRSLVRGRRLKDGAIVVETYVQSDPDESRDGTKGV